MARKRATCKVRFEADTRGTDAMLVWRGRVLNLMHLGQNPSAGEKRQARTRLMRGCAELSRARRRGLR